MKTYRMADPVRYPRMTTAELRETFLVDGLYKPGEIQMVYVDLDRTVIGMATPTSEGLALPNDADLRAEYFTERRELGVLNIGGAGAVKVGDSTYELNTLDALYVGRGNAEVSFTSANPEWPAIFYLLSYPAHAVYPTTMVKKADAQTVSIGATETINSRTITKYIHAGSVKTCQLVMGVTQLHTGSAWNTMPPHTHMRRSEVYLYFDLDPSARVLHLMGPETETRHLFLADKEAVVSPGWSMHAGVATRSYRFCWGMGGENQDYDDMDRIAVENLR
jgi:4-deoxy-L-threo-5-hexosulose-uronate ketol-isomerase